MCNSAGDRSESVACQHHRWRFSLGHCCRHKTGPFQILQWTCLIPWVLLTVGLWIPSLSAQEKLYEHAPSSAVQRMSTAAGVNVSLVASEPLVRQPVAIDFDDRGRLWVIQYLQYPNPEGLQRVEVDRYSRTTYDRIPEPPPHGPPGADRITILKDLDGDGVMDASHDFVSGLNLATGFAFGHGGVFVLNVPYLLFYPDQDRNDVPDSEPQVLLSGFGMQDAHSVANSLTFGPDGWLYGCQGSTVTANIHGTEFQQGIWRYHPVTQEFELFCEGGGNAWGLDFDSTGELLYSTNYGGYVLLHAVQGGYFVKSFAKHGQLHNRHAYGYFEHAPHENFQGGHVTVGGIVYQADALPTTYRDKYIAGDLLGHNVQWHDIVPQASTVRTRHAGQLVLSHDNWFAPTDVLQGPDGAVYVSDWHDARTAHPDPDADWDRSNGRIYRVAPAAWQFPSFDLSQLSTEALVELHADSNQWFVRRARQELVRRQDRSSCVTFAKQALHSADPAQALEALWSLHALQGLDLNSITRLLHSPHPSIRKWTLRLLGDMAHRDPTFITESLAQQLDELAETEPDLSVRQQLACSAARLPAAQAMPIINANIIRDIDHADARLPLLWWWAIERHSLSAVNEVTRRFERASVWKSRLGRQFLLPRLVRRYANDSQTTALDALLRIVRGASTESARDELWEPIWLGLTDDFASQPIAAHTGTDTSDSAARSDKSTYIGEAQVRWATHPLGETIRTAWDAAPENLPLTRVAVWSGHTPAVDYVRQGAFDSNVSPELRVEMLSLLNQVNDQSALERSAELLVGTEDTNVQLAAVAMMAKINKPQLGALLLDKYLQTSSAELQSRIRQVTFVRLAPAKLFMEAIAAGQIAPQSIPLEQVRLLTQLADQELSEQVTRYWGKLTPGTPGELLAEIRRLNNDLRAASGNAVTGQAVFTKHCAACHRLFDSGGGVGPDLTSANRQDREFLLASLVDPSSTIRPEYVTLTVQTTDGRVRTGLPTAREQNSVELSTWVDNQVRKEQILVREIEEMRASELSLMPADLYRQLSPQELRDLFAYLQSQPLQP
jgi:putative membrane-bound dehydrogenase-like protein